MKRPPRLSRRVTLALASWSYVLLTHSATLTKTDSATMHTADDWGGTLPSLEHIGRFDGTLSAANAASLSLGDHISLGGLLFVNGLKGPVTISGDHTLTLGSSGIDMSGVNHVVTNNSATFLGASQTWNLGRNLVINRPISGDTGSTLSKSGSSFLILNASNTYAGATLISSGPFTIAGATGSVANSDITLGYNTTFNLNSLPGTPLPYAVRGRDLTVDGTTIIVTGPGTENVNDAFSGTFRIRSGYTTITLNPDAAPNKNVRLTFESLSRPAGGGIVFFRGTQLGSSTLASLAPKQGNIEFLVPPTLVGGGGAYGTVTNSIIPYALGGEWNHLWNDFFVTYDSANGIRRVTTHASTLSEGTVTANNVQLTTAVSDISSPTTINALKLGTGGSVDGPGTLTIASGALLASKNSAIGTNTPGTLAFGDAEGIVSLYDSAITLSIGSAVSGTKGMTKATLGTLNLLGPVNVGDPINFMSGTLNVGGLITGPLNVSRAATLNLLPGSVVTGAVSLSVSSTGNSAGSAIIGSLTQDSGTLTLRDNTSVIGTLAVVGSTANMTNSTVTGNVVIGPEGRSGTLNLNTGVTLQGSTTVSSGTLNLNNGWSVTGTLTNLGTVNFNGTTESTLDTSFDGSGTLNQLSTAATHTLRQSPGEHAIGTITPASGATLVLDGPADAITTINNRLAPAGGTFAFAGGTWVFNMGSTENPSNIRISGGTLTASATSTRFAVGCANSSTLDITGGTLDIPSTVSWGLRLGNIHGSWHASGFNFTAAQNGGNVISRGGSGVEIGSSTPDRTCSYDLSGGTFASYANGIIIGSATNAGNASTTTFTLRGDAILVSSAAIRGYFSSGVAQQIFAFQGGTLAAAEYLAANLRPAANEARGTFLNAGGTLAPGTIGTAGKTTVNGNYTCAPGAALAIDLGGSSPANAFTNTANYYDTVTVTDGAATLDGILRLSLINGFTPSAPATFDILTSTGTGAGLSGTFANLSSGQIWATDGYSRFDVAVDTENRRVRLSAFARNQWQSATGGTWADTGSWSLAVPDGNTYAAYFGDTLSAPATVTLDQPRTLRGLTFNSPAAYTLAGSALTLAGDPFTAPRLAVENGSHTVALPLLLDAALTVDVAGSDDTLTLSGAVTGGQPLTKTGAGTLALSGDNTLGTVAVSSGRIQMTDGISSFNALSIGADASFSFFTRALTVANGLTLAAGGTFNFQTYGGGTLALRRGTDGGAIDTVAELTAAIAAAQVTVKGNPAPLSVFVIGEEEIGGVWHVTAKLKTFGTVITLQ